MLRNFKEMLSRAREMGKVTLSVAAAQDEEVLLAVKEAYELGLADAILVGDETSIREITERIGLPKHVRIINEPDIDKSALAAAKLVHNGEAQVLVKGLINSSNYLKAALNADFGLRSGNILSHLAVFEISGDKKLAFHTDGGMNIAPTLEEKRQILNNAIRALQLMGIDRPKVAALAANEQVNPKMPVTLEAKALVDMVQTGEVLPCIIEGPIAMDVAASAEAAKHKGIESKIAGDVDIFLVPDIEAGNILGKTLVKYANAKIAGIVLGATSPIVLTSRSDNSEAKLHSIALACLISPHEKIYERKAV